MVQQDGDPPLAETLPDRDPPEQRPPRQRPPGQRPTPWTETLPGQRPPWTETETPCGQTDTYENITFANSFAGDNNFINVFIYYNLLASVNYVIK